MTVRSSNIYSHGQVISLQVSVSELVPGQGAPLPSCDGLLHVLVRVYEPDPHVSEQVDQDPQFPQTPSRSVKNSINMF